MRLSELHSFQAERRVAKVNIFSDGKKDEEYVTQYCGGLEDPRYEYEEGCDSIDIPYGTEKCYCRTGARWNRILIYILLFGSCSYLFLKRQLLHQQTSSKIGSPTKKASSNQNFSIAPPFQSSATAPSQVGVMLSSFYSLS